MRNSTALMFTLLACASALGGCGSASKDEAPIQRGTVALNAAQHDARAFFATTTYSLPPGFAWSPDDQQLLVNSDETGIINAYAVPVSGEDKKSLTQSTVDSTFAVSWFPADTRLLFSADKGGNEINHLYVRELSGEVRDLTPGDKAKADFVGWSEDRRHFYVVTTERDPRMLDLYRYAAKGYARELVFRNEAAWKVAALSPNGRYLALVKARSSADQDIYLLDLQDQKSGPQLITKHVDNVSHDVYSFTHDSEQLVYSTDEQGDFREAWTYDLANGRKSPLIRANWDVTSVAFSESGRYRAWSVNEDARTVVHILDSTSRSEVTLRDLPAGDLAQIRFSRDESKVALMVSSDTSPNDVYTADLKTGHSVRLTWAMNPAIHEADLVDGQVVRYPSYDGLQIPSILYRPQRASGTNPAPALVWVHGGPGGQSRRGYSATIQHLVNQGYAILAVNNRGSSGYGKTFFHMDDKRHGDVDLQDVVYAKRYLASLDWVDGEHIGVIGGSYGGYMVGAALAFEPDVFDVGIDIVGVMNWERTLKSIPPWWASFKESLYDEMGDPATDGERYRSMSPLFHARNIKVPLLVAQGANDPRVLQVESDEIVAALKANGIPVEYLLFSNEGHGFTKRENKITASNAYVAFLDKYLKPDEE